MAINENGESSFKGNDAVSQSKRPGTVSRTQVPTRAKQAQDAAPASIPSRVTPPAQPRPSGASTEAEAVASPVASVPEAFNDVNSVNDFLNNPDFNLDSITESISPTGGRPEAESTASKFTEFRNEQGLEDLEESANSLNSQLSQIEENRRLRVEGAEGKSVASNVMDGRVSEIEKQENTRSNQIRLELQAVTGQINTKNGLVSQLMQFTQQDYQNSVQQYDSEFQQNLALVSAASSIRSQAMQELSFEEEIKQKQQNNSRANLQTYYNLVQDGQLDPSQLSSQQSFQISQLEAQAGLPVGTFDLIQGQNQDKEWKGTATYSRDGKEVTAAIMYNKKTGEPSVVDIFTQTSPTKDAQVRFDGGLMNEEEEQSFLARKRRQAASTRFVSTGAKSPSTLKQKIDQNIASPEERTQYYKNLKQETSAKGKGINPDEQLSGYVNEIQDINARKFNNQMSPEQAKLQIVATMPTGVKKRITDAGGTPEQFADKMLTGTMSEANALTEMLAKSLLK